MPLIGVASQCAGPDPEEMERRSGGGAEAMVESDAIMPEEITIDGSGRVVIPKDVRARLRLTAGARLLLVEEDDRLVLVPRATETSTVERAGFLVFRGSLAGDVPDHRQLRDERLRRLGEPS